MNKTLLTLAGLLCAGALAAPLLADGPAVDYATVVVFRHADDLGPAYPVSNNGLPSGELLPGQRLVLRLKPGTHTLLADTDAPQRFYLEAKPGDLRFIEASAQEASALLELSNAKAFVAFAPGPATP